MEQYYTNERNVQILIALLKAHGIKKVVASPGSTNVTFVASMQQDPFFEIYSSVDERSAAYIACGLAAESGEPVVLSCTGATASRNYFPGLTEAYYRNLPLLAVTSTQDESKVGHLVTQVIDRTCLSKDIAKCSVHLQNIKDADDEWDCTIKANKALLELWHHGTGPVHINLTTIYSRDFTVKNLPPTRIIRRITLVDTFPELPLGKVAIYVGTHARWTPEQLESIDAFCKAYNAVVFTDPASNYNGKYKVPYELAALQKIDDDNKNPDLLIHIGNMSDHPSIVGNPKDVWRLAEDGEIRDRYRKLSHVFEMSEQFFFKFYSDHTSQAGNDSYFKSCMSVCERLWSNIPSLPFSHIWIASQLYNKLPEHCVLHLGILSPLRSWSYFNMHPSIETYCNEGGFGIDGNMSTLLGASLVHPDKLYYGIIGDLSFFYDINVLGNRHISRNIRILLVNNSLGAEFHLFKQLNLTNVNGIEQFLSAGGHFGNQSPTLVKHFAEDLGYEYLTASNKEEFMQISQRFVTPEITDKPIIFEVFTNVNDENDALYSMCNIEMSSKNKFKQGVKNVLGNTSVSLIKSLIKD